MSAQTYPGMDCDGIEFYTKNNQVRFIHSGVIADYVDIPFGIQQILKEEIEKDEAAAEELRELYPDSEFKRMEKFIQCRFGGLDYTADITACGHVQEGEYHDCPLRGVCKSEGKICQHIKYQGKILKPLDIKLIKLLTTTKTNDVIASEVNIPLGSFHVVKRKLYEKLGFIQTKQELTRIAIELNIIQVKCTKSN